MTQKNTGGAAAAERPSENPGAFPFVHWGGHSKYALFLWELTDPLDLFVNVRCDGMRGAKRLEWVPREDLLR
jgi:hypothetical protein